LVERAARAAERSRNSHGGGLVIASNNEAHARGWRELELGFTALRMNFATCRVSSPIPDARARLGLPEDWKIVLYFGTEHPGKNPAVAFELFTALGESGDLPGWHLLVVGKIADRFAAWSAARSGSVERIHLLPGYQSEEVRNLVHAAADVQLLSFTAGWDLDSGVLGDAITWGLPVVCSSGNQMAREVERLGLGVLFETDDATSLGAALRRLPSSVDPDALVVAREEWSGATSAARHLALLDSLGP
jgi:glycosyltransferase involved in cell wall biosynthesis